jgi:signal transduction histidine kinase
MGRRSRWSATRCRSISTARAVQTIIRDVIERRRAEQALRDLNAALETKVAERTAELEHRARQLQKLTLELSQAQERASKRVAEILHEDLQRRIAGAKFQVDLLNSRRQDDPSRQLTAGQIHQILKEAIGMSRSLSHELSPAVFYANDLGEALEWLGGRRKSGMAWRFTSTSPARGLCRRRC